ncbi:Oidioi.mRNA.OKI2018_I69.PAR.g11404.t1.cds [Oikopleura dioica]|uniref:Oidioi.mRNA.OKI2018_I69.PAR.g11404.t1.cds n=1 Tax=Oikopleura dioica TaxID=34765 RepID=A0ABN7S1T6_OIKDI|nr:Oidioi.mRNA.OKI2018_I69.PAR.g11404.t1.cds [Oikopleura dioica]
MNLGPPRPGQPGPTPISAPGMAPVMSTGMPNQQMPGMPPKPGMPPQMPGQSPMQPQMGGLPPMSQPGMAPRPAMPGQPPQNPGMSPRPAMPATPGMPPMGSPGMSPMSQPGMPPRPAMPGMPPSPNMGPGAPQMNHMNNGPPRPGMPGPPQPGMPQQSGMPSQPGMPPRPGMPPQPGMAQQPGMPPQTGGMPPRPGMPPMGGPPQQMGGPPRPGMGPGAGMGGYPQQQRQKLDPDSIPSPIEVMQNDQAIFDDQTYTTDKGAVPPACTTKIKRGIQDAGSCSPRYVRSSLYSLPATSEMAKQTQIPMTLSINAMAEPDQGEPPVLLADFGEFGPLRCKRCKAYVCPQWRFIEGGRSFQCHLCHAVTEVPQHYFQMTDHMGYRMDRQQRPELCRGSYEFLATKDYCTNNKLPDPPGFIFAIDVSYNAMRTGLVHMVCETIPKILDSLPRNPETGECPVKVGFVTYSHTISFFNLSEDLSQPQMMVVGDLEEIFTPLQRGFLVDPDKCKENIDLLLGQIPQLNPQPAPDACFLPVVQAAAQAFDSCQRAGKLFLFHSSLPTVAAPGKLQNRDDRKLIGTDKEKFLFQAADKIYEKVGKDLVAASTSVELFLFPSQYVDVASMAHVCHLTGGTLYRYPFFDINKDREQFTSDAIRAVTRQTAFDAILKVRTTAGLRAVDFVGSFYMTNTQDVELAALDADKGIAIELKHDDKLNESEGAAVQVALLYTSVFGERRLRIHNLQLGVISQLADVYKVAETDAMMNFFSKLAVRSCRDTSPQKLKEGLIQRFSNILATYRKHCADPSSIGQLILPERLKVMPAYMNSLLCDDGIFPHHETNTDDRAYLRQKILQMNVRASCAYFYPCVYPILNTALDPALPKPSLRCSIERFKQEQVYVIENGLQLYIWVGQNVTPNDVQSIWGVNSPLEVPDGLPKLETEQNSTMNQLMASLATLRGRNLKPIIIRCGHPDAKITESRMRRLMNEDSKGAGTTSYVDFLVHVHKEIRQLLS